MNKKVLLILGLIGVVGLGGLAIYFGVGGQGFFISEAEKLEGNVFETEIETEIDESVRKMRYICDTPKMPKCGMPPHLFISGGGMIGDKKSQKLLNNLNVSYLCTKNISCLEKLRLKT